MASLRQRGGRERARASRGAAWRRGTRAFTWALLLRVLALVRAQYTTPADIEFPHQGIQPEEERPRPYTTACDLPCSFDGTLGQTVTLPSSAVSPFGLLRGVDLQLKTQKDAENMPLLSLGKASGAGSLRLMLSGGRVAIYSGAGNVVPGGSRVDDNDWHMLSIFLDGDRGVLETYIDGVLDRRVALGGLPLLLQDVNTNYIGRAQHSSVYFAGEIRGVHLFDVARTKFDVTVARSLSHDPTKCRQYTIWSYDKDCAGEPWNTWCADGYQQISNGTFNALTGFGGFECVAPTRSAAVARSHACAVPCSFDGSPHTEQRLSDVIVVAGNEDRSLSFWLKTEVEGDTVFFAVGEYAKAEAMGAENFTEAFGFGLRGGKLSFVGLLDDREGRMEVNDGDWHHVAAIWDKYNQEIVFYVDGARDAKLYVPKPLSTPGNATTVLAPWRYKGGKNFVGQIRDLSFFDFALSATQALTIMQGQREAGFLWLEAPSRYSWSDARDLCTQHGYTLGSYEEYCPHGANGGQAPRGGIWKGNVWAPFDGDGENAWVELGMERGTCATHGVDGRPAAKLESGHRALFRPQWGMLKDAFAGKKGQVLCRALPAPVAPLPEFGSGWELYLYLGKLWPNAVQLQLGANAGGYGSVEPDTPTGGGHKMSEVEFDKRCYREVLAIGTDRRWARVVRRDGGCIRSVDAFRVGTSPGHRVTLQDCEADSEECSQGSDHGPFFCSCKNETTFMWTKFRYKGDPWQGRRGKLRGSLMKPEEYTWAWYGRSTPEPPTNHEGLCRDIPAPEDNRSGNLSADSRWMLYMFDGADSLCPRKSALMYGANRKGLGDIMTMPTKGAHKMAESAFDEHRFTEILARDGTGAWARCTMNSGEPFTAEVAFASGIPQSLNVTCTRSDGATGTKENFQSNNGPIFDGIWNKSCQYYWAASCQRGSIFGTHLPNRSCTDPNNTFSWAWYGRSAASCRGASAKVQALALDGTRWLVDDGGALPIGNQPYTWEIRLRAYGGHGTLVAAGAAGAAMEAHVAEGGRLYQDAPKGMPLATAGAAMLRAGHWARIALTYNGTHRMTFIDGALVASDSPGNLSTEAGPLLIGAQLQETGCVESACLQDGLFDTSCCASQTSGASCLPGYSRSFRSVSSCSAPHSGTCCREVRPVAGLAGELFEVRLWNRSLDSAEQDAHVDHFSPPAGLLRWYRFDQGDTDTADGGEGFRNWATQGPSRARLERAASAPAVQAPLFVEASIASESAECRAIALGTGNTTFNLSQGANWTEYGGGAVSSGIAHGRENATLPDLLHVGAADKTLRFRWSYQVGLADLHSSAMARAPVLELRLSGRPIWSFSIDMFTADYSRPCLGGEPCPFSPEREEVIDLGGMTGNVTVHWHFVNSDRNLLFRLHALKVCSTPASTLRRVAALDGGGWRLVRHLPAGAQRWHRATDGLRGTAQYGDPTKGSDARVGEWSVRFDDWRFDEFLFASGDGTRWLIASKRDVLEGYGLDAPRFAVKSSENGLAHVLPRPNSSSGKAADYIDTLAGNSESGMVIGLQDFAGHPGSFGASGLLLYQEAGGSTWHGSKSTTLLERHGGANVFVRDSRAKGRATCSTLLVTHTVWGYSARGIGLGAYTSGALQWMGCVDGEKGSCGSASFYCKDLAEGVEFGTREEPRENGTAALRALLGSNIPQAPNGCCSNSTASGLCNAVPREADVELLCGQLGYNSGEVLAAGGNGTCAEVRHAGTWTSSFAVTRDGSGSYGSRFRCLTVQRHPPVRLLHAETGGRLSVADGGAVRMMAPSERLSAEHSWWRLEQWANEYRLVAASSHMRLLSRNNSEAVEAYHPRKGGGSQRESEWWHVQPRGDKYRIVAANSQRRLRVNTSGVLGTTGPSEPFENNEYWMFQPDARIGPPCFTPMLGAHASSSTHSGWMASGNVYWHVGESARAKYSAAYLGRSLLDDGVIKVRASLHGGSGSAGVLMRSSMSHNTFYACRLDIGNRAVALVKYGTGPDAAALGVAGGQVLHRGNAPASARPLEPNSEVLLEMRIRDSVNIDCIKDGVVMASAADLSFSYGAYGLFTSETAARFTILAAEGLRCETDSFATKHWMITPDVRANCGGIGGTMPASRLECQQAAEYLNMGFLDLMDSVSGLHEGPSCGLVYGVARWNKYGNSSSSWGPPWRGICQLNDFTRGLTEDEADQAFVDTGERMSQSACAAQCAARGLRLPCLTNAWSEAELRQRVQGAWLGHARDADGSWIWTAGCSSSFQNWAALEPQNESSSGCAHLGAAGWMATLCDLPKPCACQRTNAPTNAAAEKPNDPDVIVCDLSPCHFDGTDGLVRRLPDTAVVEGNLPRSVVFMLRMKQSAGDDAQLFVLGSDARSRAFGLRASAGRLGLTTWIDDVAPAGLFVGDDKWHHVAVTYDSQNVSFFIDGVLDRTVNFTGTLRTTNIGHNYLGRPLFASSFFRGDLKAVAFYRVALPPANVAVLANTVITPAPTTVTPPPTPAKLLGYSKMADDVECTRVRWLNKFSGTPADCAIAVSSRVDCSLYYFVHETYGEGDCGCVPEGHDCRMEVHRKPNNLAALYEFNSITVLYDRQSCNPVTWLNKYSFSASDCGARVEELPDNCSQEFFLHRTAGDGNCGCVAKGVNCLDPGSRTQTDADFLSRVYRTEARAPQPSPVPTTAPTPAPTPPPTPRPTFARCLSYTCPGFSVLKPNASERIGSDAAACCDRTCGDLVCPSGFAVGGNLTYHVSENVTFCCERLPTPAPTVQPTPMPTAHPTTAPTAQPTPAPPTLVPTAPPTHLPTVGPPTMAPTPPIFEGVGKGFCRSASCTNRMSCGHPWQTTSQCISLEECWQACYHSAACRGYAWAEGPRDNNDMCRERRLPRCVHYNGNEKVVMSKLSNQEYTCYESTKPSSVSLSLTMPGLDYEALVADEKLLQAVSDSVLDSVISAVGESFDRDNVKVRLLPGSVIADVTVLTADDSQLGDLAANIASTNVGAALAERLQRVPNISLAVVTGGNLTVSVENPKTIKLELTPATPSPTWAPSQYIPPPTLVPTPAPTAAPTSAAGLAEQLPLILGTSIPGFFLVLFFCGGYCWWRRRRKKLSRVSPALKDADLYDVSGESSGSSPRMKREIADFSYLPDEDEEKADERLRMVARLRAETFAKKQIVAVTVPVAPKEQTRIVPYRKTVQGRRSMLPDGTWGDEEFEDEFPLEEEDMQAPACWLRQDLMEEEFMFWEDVSPEVFESISTVIRRTFKHSDPHKPARLKVSAIHRVESAELYRNYMKYRREIIGRRGECTKLADLSDRDLEITSMEWPEEMREGLNPNVNEVYLLAGCSAKAAAMICEKGVWKMKRDRGIMAPFGSGFYMFENSSKADEGTFTEERGPAQGYCCMLVCRATLGEPYRTRTTSDKVLGEVADAIESREYDSVFADPDVPSWEITYRQIVAVRPAQVYPAYVVFYKRKGGRDSRR